AAPGPNQGADRRHGTDRGPIHPRNHAPVCEADGLPNSSPGDDAPPGGRTYRQLPGGMIAEVDAAVWRVEQKPGLGHAEIWPSGGNLASVRDPCPVLFRLRLRAFLSDDRRKRSLTKQIDDFLEV